MGERQPFAQTKHSNDEDSLDTELTQISFLFHLFWKIDFQYLTSSRCSLCVVLHPTTPAWRGKKNHVVWRFCFVFLAKYLNHHGFISTFWWVSLFCLFCFSQCRNPQISFYNKLFFSFFLFFLPSDLSEGGGLQTDLAAGSVFTRAMTYTHTTHGLF